MNDCPLMCVFRVCKSVRLWADLITSSVRSVRCLDKPSGVEFTDTSRPGVDKCLYDYLCKGLRDSGHNRTGVERSEVYFATASGGKKIQATHEEGLMDAASAVKAPK